MPEHVTTIPRNDWHAVVAAFSEFFAGVGNVTAAGDSVVFAAGDTGLSLNRDGTSQSFMPLHELGARWDAVTFDSDAATVELRSSGVSYLYRVPSRLLAP